MEYRTVTKWAIPVVLLVGAVVMIACGGDNDSEANAGDQGPANQGSGTAVVVQMFKYSPAAIEVKAGHQVTWTNKDDILHTVTAGAPGALTGQFDGQLDGPNMTFSQRFEQAGRYLFFCSRHNGMTGEVNVTN